MWRTSCLDAPLFFSDFSLFFLDHTLCKALTKDKPADSMDTIFVSASCKPASMTN